jgi:transcriptional regulator EpsA
MSNLLDLSPQTLAHVHHALHSAGGVRQRRDIFLWSQGPVQTCLPHTLMACVLFDDRGNSVSLDCFHGTVIDAHILDEVMAPQTGLLTELAQHCQQGGGAPLLIDDSAPAHAMTPPARAIGVSLERLTQRCARLELGPALVVSTGVLAGGLSSCFVFFKLALPTAVPPLELARMFLPHFHLALCRSWGAETKSVTPMPLKASVLTKRQLQILNWAKQGKTNFEIAAILDVSPLTVKNHLQQLFKRLNVHNRTQAVAKFMADPVAFGDPGAHEARPALPNKKAKVVQTD